MSSDMIQFWYKHGLHTTFVCVNKILNKTCKEQIYSALAKTLQTENITKLCIQKLCFNVQKEKISHD